MKKLLLIILIVCMIVGINSGVLAEVKFGNWDKWDEMLPPTDSKDWKLAISDERHSMPVTWGPPGGDIILFETPVFFKEIQLFFYSPGDVNIKSWRISGADLALAAFPPKRKKITIRAYKREDQVFKFFEEWKFLLRMKSL